jgi:ribonuclease HII
LSTIHRIGIDENGLGSRLGPLVVTAVLARVDEKGARALARRVPKRLRTSVDDSKRLVSHTDARLGEAWARELAPPGARGHAELFERLSLEGTKKLKEPCPREAEAQCWHGGPAEFEATAAQLRRVAKHRALLAKRGIELVTVRTSVVCTERLNAGRRAGANRFVMDLHAMERLVIELRREVGENVHAVCGKVGGMGQYSKFFGPLAGHLHAIMDEGQKKSAYRFPGLGDLVFLRDADASDALVMLASLVGKYVRELFMGRIAAHYPASEDDPRPSGYHDPVTEGFVARTALVRRERRIPDGCFERDRDVIEA